MRKAGSNEYLWMPVSFEQTLGNQLHDSQVKNNRILARDVRRNRTLYSKADAALNTAAKDYTKLPYETKLYVIESDEINAEALPAGYIYVTRKAANDLDDSALQLVLGHEVAHVAKRHTSKQIQQRLLDTGLAVEMLERILETRSTDDLDKVLGGGQVIQRFRGTFAQYDQGQELQADACSIRSMLSAGTDPLKVRAEYLRKRGTQDT
jgi:predicted Zn-dependent protease